MSKKKRSFSGWRSASWTGDGWTTSSTPSTSPKVERNDEPLIKVGVVKACPYAAGSQGILRIPTGIVAQMAHTVRHEAHNEWAIILLGKREENGLVVTVEDFLVPANQQRSGGEVDLPHITLSSDVVGVVHSHHSMGAFFSEKDRTELNTRFPVSLVISYRNGSHEAAWLGWEYLCTGKIKLPCGKLGEVPFKVLPIGEGAENWPLKWEPRLAAQSGFTSLGDCSKWELDTQGDTFYAVKRGACGLIGPKQPQSAVFGRVAGIEAKLPPPLAATPLLSTQGGYTVIDKREALVRQLGDGGYDVPEETQGERLDRENAQIRREVLADLRKEEAEAKEKAERGVSPWQRWTLRG